MKKNISQKILAVILGLFIWLNFALIREYELEIFADIKVENIPKNFVITEISVAKIPFLIKAKGIHFIRLSLNGLNYQIDASNFLYGENKQQVELDRLDINFDMGKAKIVPNLKNYIVIFLDNFISVEKPIKLVFDKKATEELFVLKEGEYTPKKVKISGPKLLIKKIDFIETVKITKDDIEDDLVNLAAIENVILQPREVVLKTQSSSEDTRVISFIKIEHPTNITIIPQKVSIKIKGDGKLLENISSSKIKAYIEANKIKESGKMVEVKIELPEGVSLKEKTPENVQVLKNE